MEFLSPSDIILYNLEGNKLEAKLLHVSIHCQTLQECFCRLRTDRSSIQRLFVECTKHDVALNAVLARCKSMDCNSCVHRNIGIQVQYNRHISVLLPTPCAHALRPVKATSVAPSSGKAPKVPKAKAAGTKKKPQRKSKD